MLLEEIKSCTTCAQHLPLGPKPTLQFSEHSRVMIVGQAPGVRVHNTGIPWNDPSGERLREWMGVSVEEFYDTNYFAIVPMGFCYPGTGKSGDLPPRPECAKLWMQKVLHALPRRQLTLLIGQYAQAYFLNSKQTLTETVRNWKEYFPEFIVLPHPSPRNNIWLKKNPWFTQEVLPQLRCSVRSFLS